MPENQKCISRRTALKATGAVGAVALVGAAATTVSGIAPEQALAASESNGAGVQNAFWFDVEKCIGCQSCAMACADTYQLDKAYRSVYNYTTEVDGKELDYNVSVGCSFCGNAACIKVCPTGAMHKTEDFGHVLVDADKCIGCGYCAMACPYAVPRVDKEKGHSIKCTGCYEYAAMGKEPMCVQACREVAKTEALKFGTIQEMIELGGELANVAPLPDPNYTTPSFIISADDDKPAAGTNEGEVTNMGEMI